MNIFVIFLKSNDGDFPPTHNPQPGIRNPEPRTLNSELNPQQLAAATAPDGPMLIIAGAGTGKTRTLTYRLAHLVERGVNPRNILLMTFTNRAANEMLERAANTIHRNIGDLMGGTFHHIGNVFLRRYGEMLGIAHDFTIIDKEDSKALMRVCVRELKLDKLRGFPNKGSLVSISGFIQNTLDPLETVLGKRFPMFQEHRDNINETLTLYNEKKQAGNLLDFDDLLSGFHTLLTGFPEIRTRLGDRFQHILVDEYQDTNAVQGEIVDLLANKHRNVCVVGDDAQSIYSFRGADFSNILRFQSRYPDAKTYRLEQNYRSQPGILALANDNIRHNEQRLPKDLRPTRSDSGKPVAVPVLDDGDQARFIGQQIEDMIEQHLPASDIAVLYRSHYHSMEIQLELQHRGIPFNIRGGLRFFEQAHVKDIVSFLRIKHNPLDQTAWLRVLPMIQGVGHRTAEKFWNAIRIQPAPLAFAHSPQATTVFSQKIRPEFANFANCLAVLEATDDVAEIVDTILDVFYRLYLQSNYNMPKRRLEDIKAVTSYASQFDDLDEFLADIALAADYSGENDDQQTNSAVLLSTIHQAKGLEWPVVFIPWLNEGRFPAGYSGNEQEDIEEERRIFHVAVTRAKDRLFLCMPRRQKRKGGGSSPLLPSRFITELAPELMESCWEAEKEIEFTPPPPGSRFANRKRRQEPGWGTAPRTQDHHDDPVYDYGE
jgi:DNA helicase-2/ATP-dependent DNA helicase PcrA